MGQFHVSKQTFASAYQAVLSAVMAEKELHQELSSQDPGLQLNTKSFIVSICGTFTDPKNPLTSFLVFIWKQSCIMWSSCRDSDDNFASDLFKHYVLPRWSPYKQSTVEVVKVEVSWF